MVHHFYLIMDISSQSKSPSLMSFLLQRWFIIIQLLYTLSSSSGRYNMTPGKHNNHYQIYCSKLASIK